MSRPVESPELIVQAVIDAAAVVKAEAQAQREAPCVHRFIVSRFCLTCGLRSVEPAPTP